MADMDLQAAAETVKADPALRLPGKLPGYRDAKIGLFIRRGFYSLTERDE